MPSVRSAAHPIGGMRTGPLRGTCFARNSGVPSNSSSASRVPGPPPPTSLSPASAGFFSFAVATTSTIVTTKPTISLKSSRSGTRAAEIVRTSSGSLPNN